MCEDIAAFLREETGSLPVSITDALVAGVAALALDRARETGQVVDLAAVWAEFDAHGVA